MAVTNTGVVLRTITGVNESDLFLDSEATSVATNTGIVERSIVGVNDANFVRPLGDELVLNGDFSNGSTGWELGGNSIVVEDGLLKFNFSSGTYSRARQNNSSIVGNVKITYTVVNSNIPTLLIRDYGGGNAQNVTTTIGTHTIYRNFTDNGINFHAVVVDGGVLEIDNVSVKEVLVSRESTATNTGIVERSLTGVNESDLWLDSESTSVVNNTGIVERPITGVNESDPMFPDNTISNIRNLNDVTLYEQLLEALQLRAAYYENEEGTTEILTNLFNC